jgi:bacterioferritin (cytochrome b1)
MTRAAYRYAGLQRPQAPGLSVADSVERLRRFAYAERRCMALLASRIVTIPHRDAKALLGRLQYEDATHADGWRERVLELRTNKSKLEGTPDPALQAVFDHAEHLPASYPFLAALTTVLKPALRQAYAAYRATANDLADYASVRLVCQALADEEEHGRLLAALLADLTPSAEEQTTAAQWAERLQALLAAAGGIDCTLPRRPAPPAEPLPRFQIPHALQRDGSLPRVWDFVAPPLDRVPEHLDYMMALRLSEINVAEGLAIVLYETEDMPWSFYLDISRHLWDEVRHSLFGEAAIERTYGDRAALPMRDYEGVFAMEAPALEQYAVLGLEVEGKNMRYPPGKRQEWEFARDRARHALMTTFQDFDWADEVLHVQIARRRLDSWFVGGLKAIGDFSRQGKEHRTEVKHRQAPSAIPHPDAEVSST